MTDDIRPPGGPWRKLARPPLSTDRTYPFNRPLPAHWPKTECIVFNRAREAWTYFSPGSPAHLCGDYDAMMVPGPVFARVEAVSNLAALDGLKYGTILADPPWRFTNRTGKVAPEHKRLRRYQTMTVEEICALPIAELAADKSHLYLWCPNALMSWGQRVIEAWGFTYKTNIIWEKVRKDGQPDGRGVGFYFRNATEMVLFGVRGKLRTDSAGRRQVNIFRTRKREHSRKPEELYEIIENCSPYPRLELFAREARYGWTVFGDDVKERK